MIDSWQNLLNKPVDISGYDQAIDHYRNLKNKMLDQIANNAKIDVKSKSYKQFIDNTDKLILQNASDWGQGFQKAQETLERVETSVAKLIESGSTNEVKQLLQEIRKQVYDKQDKIKDAQKNFKQKLNLNKDLIFTNLGKDSHFIENMIGVQNNSGDVSDIVNQASSYFIRYLYSQLFDEKSFAEGSRFKYILSMGGYYKELHEYQALEKILSNFLNVYHAGSVKIGGKDTEIDIFFSTLNNLESGLTQNIEITQMISSIPEPPGTNDLILSLIEQINTFGEQVKSKSLGKNNSFEIGNRATLYSNYLSEGGNKHSSLEAIHFLSRFKNIILSFGISNVLFSSNGKRQWMSDFIEDFRKQAYLLSFMRAKDDSELTEKVGLEQLYTKSKTQIRNRFKK